MGRTIERLTGAETLDEVRPVTALFADVVGSTSLGERLALDEVKTLVGECVSRMTEAIESYGGVVRAFMGDGVAGFFGLEGAREDDPVRAALAGLRILEVIEGYAHELEDAWSDPSISIRIGINTGRVATGLVGHSEPLYVALGDVVNVAARLQSSAAPGTILAGASTVAYLGRQFELDAVGEISIRGRDKPVKAWRVRSHLAFNEPEDPIDHFVGREVELSRLQEAFEGLSLGRGQIPVVVGEAGIGKTSLISESRKRMPADVMWLSMRCTTDQVLRPYGPVVDMLRAWLGIEEPVPEVVVRVRLLAKLRQLLSTNEFQEVMPYFGQLLAVTLDVPSEEKLRRQTPEHKAESLKQAFSSWLQALSGRGPVVVMIDDLERADDATVGLLSDAFELTDTSAVMFLLALRPEPDSIGWEARVMALARYSHRSSEIRIERLHNDEADRLVALVDVDERLSFATRRELVVRAEGNPLYLAELARAALEELETVRLPCALEGVLLARIDKLPPKARRVLQVAAVCGRRFPRSILEGACGSDRLSDELAQLVRASILQEDGRAPSQHYAFRHGLYQEAVLGTLTTERMRGLHEAVAHALEASDGVEQALEIVAAHFVSSGNTAKAVDYLERAGRRATALSSLGEAVELFEQARSLSENLPDRTINRRVTWATAQLTTEMGKRDEAMQRWLAVFDASDTDDEKARTLLEIARTDLVLGDGRGAGETCERALSLVCEPDTRAGLEILLARVALRHDDPVRSEELLRRAEETLAVRPAQMELDAASLWAGCMAVRGRFGEAEEWAGRALKVAEELGDFGAILKARRDLGIINLVLGNLGDARTLLGQAFEDAMSSGHTVRAIEAIPNLLNVCLLVGDIEHGARLGREVVEWLDVPRWRSAVLMNLGGLEVELAETRSAKAHLRECVAMSDRFEDARLAGTIAEVHLATLDLDEQDIDSAKRRAFSTLEVCRAMGGRHDVGLRAHACLADAAILEDDHNAALEHASEAVKLSSESDRTESPLAWRTLGKAQASAGLDEAFVSLENALDIARAIGMRLEEARALMCMGILASDPTGDHIRRAREIFAYCGCERGLEEVKRAIALLVR